MAFTKINAAGIGTTERVTVDGLTVINNLSVGGTVSIAGTLTYEDVTNVDAVGIITARSNILVGSGITLSPDGDVFAVGVGTFSGGATFDGDVNVSGSRVRVTGPSTITNNTQTIMAIDSADDNTAGLGGKIGFAAKVNETTRTLAAVGGLKAIAGTGNFSGDLALYTRRNGIANLDERVRITSAGFVGIGTAIPASLLTLGKSANPTLELKDYTNNARAIITAGSNGQLVFTTDVGGVAATSDFVFRADGNLGEVVRFASDGKVGIGTANSDGNLHVYNSSAGSVTAATDANNLVLESATNVGMSFLTANDQLSRIKFGDPDATNAGIIVYSHDGDSMRFHTATSERLRIDSDGRLLVNSTAARAVGGNTSRLLQVESSGGGAGISIVRNQNTASPPTLDLGKSRGYPHTIVSNGDKLGIINFAGADGTDLVSHAAQIVGEVDGTPGENDMPGRLVFKTTADGASSTTERLRITSGGNIGIGTAAPTALLHLAGGGGLGVIELQRSATNTTGNVGAINFTASDGHSVASMGAYGGGDNESAYINFKTTTSASANSPFTSTTERMRIHSNGDISVGTTNSIGRFLIKSAGNGSGNSAFRVENSDGTYLFILRNDGLFQTGNDGNSPYNITGSTGANVFIHASSKSLRRSTSSIRYKKDIADATWGLAEVLKLRPVTFKSNGTGDMADDQTYGGFTAEDIHDLGLTEFVQYNENNEPDALSYGHMVALLTNAIKELNAKIVALGG